MNNCRKKKIAPSIMCADFFKLKECIKQFEECGIELLHVDIMDGNFVPNYTLGTDFVKALKENTDIPLDLHFMIEHPESKMDWFAFGPGDYVSVHYESTPHIHKTVAAIRKKGAKAMVALNPGTPIQVLENLLDDIDGVLVMTVDPGFAGQKLVEACAGKVKKLREYLDTNGYPDKEIEVDGNISFENAGRMNRMGADIFVAGSSSVFSGEGSIGQNITRFREVLRQLY